MKLSIALPALAGGLVLGWAALASADAPPPAAPIFYCPTPPAAGPAPASAKSPAKPATHARLQHANARQGCPMRHRELAANDTHQWRERVEPLPPVQPPHGPYGRHYAVRDGQGYGDVSASQAFIYRYERALHGLNPRAADEAWAHDHHGFDGHEGYADGRYAQGGGEGQGAPAPIAPPHFADQPPPPVVTDDGLARDRQEAEAHWRAQRDLEEHQRWAEEHRGDDGQPPVQAAPPAPPPAPIAPPHFAQAWADHGAGASVRVEQRDTERSGGWSYSEEDGHAQMHRWGDMDGGHDGDGRHDDGRHDDGHRAPPPPCPQSCSGGQAAFQAGDGVWQDGSYGAVYKYAGRDASGYLVWPGKTPN